MTEPGEVEVHRDAEAVGAPPYALPESEGGEAGTVGHPDSPATLADSPVRGGTEGLDAPHNAADPAPEPTAVVAEPVAPSEVPGPDDAPVEAPATEA